MNTQDILNTINRLQIECAKVAKNSEFPEYYKGLAHNLSVAYQSVEKQDWRYVFEDIAKAEQALVELEG